MMPERGGARLRAPHRSRRTARRALPLTAPRSCPCARTGARRARAPGARGGRCAPRSARGCPRRRVLRPAAAGARGTMRMQSTGQGATHSSQPVHSAASTVCICFCAPTIASTGHGGRHLAQPMHAASSISATSGGPSAPHAGFRGSACRPRSAARASMVAAPPGGHWLMSAVAVRRRPRRRGGSRCSRSACTASAAAGHPPHRR